MALEMGDCRFCGTSEGVKVNIFNPVCDYVSKIELVLPLQVRTSDSLPKVMCHRCMHIITEFYEFRKKCLTLDLKWKTKFYSEKSASVANVEIKAEPQDPALPVKLSPENSWSITPAPNSSNSKNGTTVVVADKQYQPVEEVDVITVTSSDLEDDKCKVEGPGEAIPKSSTVSKKNATERKRKSRKTRMKRIKLTSEKYSVERRGRRKNKSAVTSAAAGMPSVAVQENAVFKTPLMDMPLPLAPVRTLQKLPNSKIAPSVAMPKLSPEIPKPRLNSTKRAAVPSQIMLKETPKAIVSQPKVFPEKQTPAVCSPIGVGDHQGANLVEQHKPPAVCEKALPTHIIMTSIPNVCTIYTCSLCERTFTSRILACFHSCVKKKSADSVSEKNENEKNDGLYTCSHCNMKFARYASLVPHEETHLQEHVEDSDTSISSSSSDKEKIKKKKKKYSGSNPVRLEGFKKLTNAFA